MTFDVIFDPVVFRICLAALAMGALAGVSGAFVVLQKQALLGDVIAHSTLPGVCFAWWATRSDVSSVLVAGAFVAGAFAYFILRLLSAVFMVKPDAALSVTLSVFFGFGILILSHLQRLPYAGEAGLENFIFGNLATVTHADLISSIVLLVLFVFFLFFFWRKLSIFLFDKSFAWTRFGSLRSLQFALGAFIISSVGVCLQGMGALLMTSLLVAPAVAARAWSKNLFSLVFLSGVVGGISCLVGSYWSAFYKGVPPGPASTLVALAFVSFSLGVRKCWESIGSRFLLRA